MMRKNKPLFPLTLILIGALNCLTGCMTAAPSAIFNPDAVYQIPPEGAFLPDLVDDATRQRTGKIWVPPGTLLIYEPAEVSK